MSYKKFDETDIIFNTVKTKPKFKFKIYGGSLYINNTVESSIYLQKLNEEVIYIPPTGCLLDYAYDFSCAANSQYVATM